MVVIKLKEEIEATSLICRFLHYLALSVLWSVTLSWDILFDIFLSSWINLINRVFYWDITKHVWCWFRCVVIKSFWKMWLFERYVTSLIVKIWLLDIFILIKSIRGYGVTRVSFPSGLLSPALNMHFTNILVHLCY